MAAKPSPEELKAAKKAELRACLVAQAQANPFAFFTAEETRIMFGFGNDTMTVLRSTGAPVVGRLMHPGLLLKWIELNAGKIPKVNAEEEEK